MNGLLCAGSPDRRPLGNLLQNASDPFTTLPGPIGELANNTVAAISDSINNLLSRCRRRSRRPRSRRPSRGADPADVPDASLEVAGAMTLLSADPVEKKVEKKVEARIRRRTHGRRRTLHGGR